VSNGGGGGGKKFNDSKINQTHGYTFGESNAESKAAFTTKAACTTSSSTHVSDDDLNLKLTATSSSYDIKIKRRKACQMKGLVVLLGMLTAACIGCLVAYFYMKYKYENELHFNLTQNMVMERSCKKKGDLLIKKNSN
jgi:hypothetical protein